MKRFSRLLRSNSLLEERLLFPTNFPIPFLPNYYLWKIRYIVVLPVLIVFPFFVGKNERANENFRNERNFSSVNRCLESGSRQLSRGIGFEWHSLLEKREMELNLERLSARISVCLLVMHEIASSLHREKFYQFFTRLVRFDSIGRLDG